MGYECSNTSCDLYDWGYCKCPHTVEYCKTKCMNKANWKGDDPIIDARCKWYQGNKKGCSYPTNKKNLLESKPAETPLAAFCRGRYGMARSKKYCDCYEKGE